MTSALIKTDEVKIIAAAVLFIAIPSVILSIVALVVLSRETRMTDERFREAHEEAMIRAVERTVSALQKEEEEALEAGKRIAEANLPGQAAWEQASMQCGAERGFREVYVLGKGGAVLFPDVAPELSSPPDPWLKAIPETAEKLHRFALMKEFEEENPFRASRAWRALHEHCMDLEGPLARRLEGMALFGEARSERKSGNLGRAAHLFDTIARRYRDGWGEGNIPLAAAAFLEGARLARETSERESEERAWLALATFLGRNEEILSEDLTGFFAAELLQAQIPGAREKLGAFRGFRAALAAFRTRFGEALRNAIPPGGYVASSIPGESAYVVPLETEGKETLEALVFLPNRAHFAALFRQWALDLKLEEELRLVLTDAEGNPIDPADGVPEGFKAITERAFPSPLADWRATLFVKPLGGMQSLWFLRWSLTLWVILVAGAAVVGGTVFVVRSVNREIRQAREKADFVSSVTHELKTPLTSIRMFTETLMQGRVQQEEEKRECLRVIAEETERLSRLINRMLDFSKMERGLRRFHFREHEPASIAREAVQAFKAQQKTGAEVNLQVLDPLSPVRCDRDALIEVLLNLISNAVKYSKNEKSVTVRVWASRGKTKWAVMDRGIGIPRYEQRRIFQKFYRVDDSLAKEVDGCGLGLAISAHIARAHEGAIRVESEAGRGAIITLEIPEAGPRREDGNI
ncbi:MAG: sensor histidine kinase [Planctomycetota bacterium]